MTTHAHDWYQHSPTPGVYDEALDEHGQVRPAWSTLSRRFAGLGELGLAERRTRCEHLLAAHGATHVPHRELLGASASWSTGWRLDPVPFVIGREEWAQLAAAVAERARLVAAVADDLAGPRTLVRDGVVPAAALWSDPAFMPLTPPGAANSMWWYGADLIRGADGTWRVLRDVTDVVSGLGQALLHRSVMTRAYSDSAERPAPLTDHLVEFRAALARSAPEGSVSPRTVVLTPEAGSLEYVATSYLASQLGFHRTSAADLVVRERKVYLRSLGGLEPVDVVLRAVPATDLDPLANPRGYLGVPGIVQAKRAGAVAIVNPVSAALVGSPGMAPHLLAAARHLTGRAPTLASVPTHWCGDPAVVSAVRAEPSRWVLNDIMTGEAAFGSTLESSEAPGPREDWLSRLRLRPTSLVALEFVPLATVPVVRAGVATAGAVVIGVSAVIRPDGVDVMPGGFARVVDPYVPIVGQRSGWAKDVWVDAARPTRATTLASALPQVDLRTSLPTRSAEAMYWLGRAAEGAEVRARLIRTVAERAATVSSAGGAAPGSWGDAATRLLAASGGSPVSGGNLDEALADAVRGKRGLVEQLDALALAASSVREFLSTTTGRVLADIGDLRRSLRPDDAESLERLLVSLAALAGLSQESTVRGPAWRLLDLGRRIERAIAVLGAVQAAFAEPVAPEQFQAVGETVLAAHEALVAYRRWHRTDVELDAAIDLLVRDDTNPRSVAFQLDRISEHLASLPSSTHERALVDEAASAALESLSVTALVLAVRGPLLALSEQLVRRWFSDPVAPRRLGELDQ